MSDDTSCFIERRRGAKAICFLLGFGLMMAAGVACIGRDLGADYPVSIQRTLIVVSISHFALSFILDRRPKK